MRLWSIHPRYLDQKGLLALWREGLLAQQVLLGRTRGYTRHPQLRRFQACPDPAAAIGCYLAEVVREASRRGYTFDGAKIVKPGPAPTMTVHRGQIDYEWQHLLGKLVKRAPDTYEKNKDIVRPRPHPLFAIIPGDIEDWERT